MQARRAGLAVVAAMVFAMAAAPAHAKAGDDTVVAVINGTKILKKDVMGALKNLQVKDEDTARAFPNVLDQMINEVLISSEVAKAEIEKSEEFKQRMDAARAQIIKGIFIESKLKSKVTDKAVKAEYDKFRKENKGKQEVRARHILLKTEAEAKQAIKDLDSGIKFETLAKERSSGPTAQNGGDVGYFIEGELVPEFSDAAFKLKPGEYTKEPVKSQFGWHVILVEDKRKRSVPDMKEVEAAIRSKLGQQAVEQLVKDLRAKAEIQRFDMDGKPVAPAPGQN